MKNWIATTIRIAAIAIAMVAMAKVAPIEGMDFDYYGAIIGVLSFLVTLLMGYQEILRLVDNDVDRDEEHAFIKLGAKYEERNAII